VCRKCKRQDVVLISFVWVAVIREMGERPHVRGRGRRGRGRKWRAST